MEAHGKSEPEVEAHDCDVRCGCGALLARVVEGGVEIKCRRCKRVVIVPLEAPLPKDHPTSR